MLVGTPWFSDTLRRDSMDILRRMADWLAIEEVRILINH